MIEYIVKNVELISWLTSSLSEDINEVYKAREAQAKKYPKYSYVVVDDKERPKIKQ